LTALGSRRIGAHWPDRQSPNSSTRSNAGNHSPERFDAAAARPGAERVELDENIVETDVAWCFERFANSARSKTTSRVCRRRDARRGSTRRSRRLGRNTTRLIGPQREEGRVRAPEELWIFPTDYSGMGASGPESASKIPMRCRRDSRWTGRAAELKLLADEMAGFKTQRRPSREGSE
jgi:hypothetical protein